MKKKIKQLHNMVEGNNNDYGAAARHDIIAFGCVPIVSAVCRWKYALRRYRETQNYDFAFGSPQSCQKRRTLAFLFRIRYFGCFFFPFRFFAFKSLSLSLRPLAHMANYVVSKVSEFFDFSLGSESTE